MLSDQICISEKSLGDYIDNVEKKKDKGQGDQSLAYLGL